MANLSVSGLDELTATLDRSGGMDEETIQEILHAGGDIIVAEIQKEMAASRFALDRIAKAVKYGKTIKRNKNGDPYITVTLSGKTAAGTKNSTVTFVLNYGRSKKYGLIQGGYFWTVGAKNAESKVTAAAEEIISKKLKERGLA